MTTKPSVLFPADCAGASLQASTSGRVAERPAGPSLNGDSERPSFKATPEPCSILVVEPDDDIRDLLGDLLLEKFSFVRLARNATEAVKFCRDQIFDLIFVDRIISGPGNLESMRRSQKDLSQPIFVFMTGESRVNLESLYGQGAAAILRKPLDLDEVARIAEILLYGRSSQVRPGGKRVPTHIPIQFRMDQQPRRGVGKVLNISGTGMLVESADFIPEVGWKIEFKMTYDSHRTIEGTASVRWIQQNQNPVTTADFGIEFLTVTPQIRQDIEGILHKLEINLRKVA